MSHRDEVLLLNINKWLQQKDITLPPDLDELTNWDIFETFHDDNITIATIGCTVYQNSCNKSGDAITQFLQESDDEDDDLKFQISKTEQLRIVFDCANKFDTNSKPNVLAMYHKQNGQFQQIYAVKDFNDNEIDQLCIADDNDREECDLSLLFKSFSKKQLINGLKSFLNKNKNKHIFNKLIIKNINELMVQDEECLKLIIAQIVGIDEGILLQFNAFIDNDLYELKKQFKQNMKYLKNDIFDSKHFENVLNDIQQIVKKTYALNQMKQKGKEIALDLLIFTVETFLINFLSMTETNDLYVMDIENNSKLKYAICDLECALEKVCNNRNVKGNDNDKYMQKLLDLQLNLNKWQKILINKIPSFGPLFSDNIRALNNIFSKKKKKRKRVENTQINTISPRKKQRNK